MWTSRDKSPLSCLKQQLYETIKDDISQNATTTTVNHKHLFRNYHYIIQILTIGFGNNWQHEINNDNIQDKELVKI